MKEITAYGIIEYTSPVSHARRPEKEGPYRKVTGLNTVEGFNAASKSVQLSYANCIADIFWEMELKRFFCNISCDIDNETYNAWCDKHEEVLITCLELASINRK